MIPSSVRHATRLLAVTLGSIAVAAMLVLPPAHASPLDCLVDGVGDRCEAWSRAYDDPSARGGPEGYTGRNDSVAVLVSPSGDRVYQVGYVLTGSNQGFTRVWAVDPATGDELWVATHGGPTGTNHYTWDAALSPDGNRLFVTGSARANLTTLDSDAVTVAFDTATGERLWASSFDGPNEAPVGDVDLGVSVRPSPDGERVYVAVSSFAGAPTGYDIQTLAYDAGTGEAAWSVRYDPPDFQQASALAVTPDGERVVVVGYGQGDGMTQGEEDDYDYDWVVIAYETGEREGTEGGEEAWLAPYDASTLYQSYDYAHRVVMHPDGERAFVIGQSGNTGTRADFTTRALDVETGAFVWEARYRPDGPGGLGFTTAADAELDAEGNRLFITGRGQRQENGYVWEAVTAAFDTETGALLWADSYERDHSSARAISVAPDGEQVFVSSWYDLFITVAYDADTGGRLWTGRFDSSLLGMNTDTVSANAVSPDGERLFVAGSFSYHEPLSSQAEAGNNSDAGLVVYDLGES